MISSERELANGAKSLSGTIPTLNEWMGGPAAIERLLSLFYRRVREDEVLAPVFAEMSAEHAARVGRFICEVFGGPAAYTSGGGSHRGMISHHFGRNLTEAQRRRWVNLLLDCADEAGVPDDPEFRSAFVGYLEWGSRLAAINSRPGAVAPDEGSPMPRWGWGETGGPYTG